MKRTIVMFIVVLSTLLPALAGGAAAQGAAASDAFPIGPAAGEKDSPVAFMDAAGNSVVAWSQANSIVAQRLDAAGAEIGAPIQLNEVNEDETALYDNDIAADAGGNFVAVWYAWPTLEVRGRCFLADGTPRGPEFLLNGTGGGEFAPAVQMAPDGSFVAVWSQQFNDANGYNYQIIGRGFSAACAPIGDPFTVNNVDTGYEYEPDMAMDAAGNFMVVWYGEDKADGGIFARRFNAAGAPQAGQFRVNKSQPLSQYRPAVTMDAAGNAVVAFITGVKGKGFDLDVLVRRYAADGTPIGNPFSPHAPSKDVQYLPQVAAAPDGPFAVMWTVETEGDRNIWLQAYDAAGDADGPALPVTVDDLDGYMGALATGSGETFLAAWPSPVALDMTQIYGRLFTFGEPANSHTFLPTNDTYVAQDRPNAVYGANRVLQVKDAAADANTYIKFNVSGLSGTVQAATLRLWVTNGGPQGGRVYATSPYYPGTTTQWLETGLNWNNAPAIEGASLDDAGEVVPGGWIELDVTPAVVAALAGDGRAGFALTNDSSNLVTYGSKESAHAPELIVVTD